MPAKHLICAGLSVAGSICAYLCSFLYRLLLVLPTMILFSTCFLVIQCLVFLRNGRYTGARAGLRDFTFVSREVFLLE